MLQTESWVMMQDRKFHYQVDGTVLCRLISGYALFEESSPDVNDCCNICLNMKQQLYGNDL